MVRSAIAGIVLAAGCLGFSGCAHIDETQVIEDFTAALQQQDLKRLRANSSENFNEKALRLTESLDDLQILRLPEEPPAIVEVEDVNENEKTVTVETPTSGRRLLYRIKREGKTDRWVVDDIYMKQKKEGVRVTKSVTEQMDLLLSVREFLTAWQSNDRQRVLDITTSEFSDLLRELPPGYLVELTQRIVGDGSRQSKVKPQAQLDEKVAMVRLPRTSGELLISMRLLDDGWRVNDVAIDGDRKSGQIRSARKQVAIILATVEFLDAYAAEDRVRLEHLATPKFYRNALVPGDLSTVPLPTAHVPVDGYEVRLHGDHATFIAPANPYTVKIDLVQRSGGKVSADIETTHESGVPSDGLIVEEVTLYENDGSQQKQLSSLFTARARVMLFADALQSRDLTTLQRLASPEFNRRVWEQVDSEILQLLPIDAPSGKGTGKAETRFRAAVTEVVVPQKNGTATFVLRDLNGELGIDDVLVPHDAQPDSLRERLEFMVPIARFAEAIRANQVDRILPLCSSDFNRLVWKQTQRVPDIGFPIDRHLRTPLSAMQVRSDQAVVRLGDDRFGAIVHIIQEHDQWVIDEARVIAGVEPQQRAEMKQTMRIQIGRRLAHYDQPVIGNARGSARPKVEMPLRKSDELFGSFLNTDTNGTPTLDGQQPNAGNVTLLSGTSDRNAANKPANAVRYADGTMSEVNGPRDIGPGDTGRNPAARTTADQQRPAQSVSGLKSASTSAPRHLPRVTEPSLAPIAIPFEDPVGDSQ